MKKKKEGEPVLRPQGEKRGNEAAELANGTEPKEKVKSGEKKKQKKKKTYGIKEEQGGGTVLVGSSASVWEKGTCVKEKAGN